MIITQTPYRISMFGGGTDHPTWFSENDGCVISFAIDKYCYISLRELPPYFNHKFRVVYSKVETVETVDEIKHPAVREAFKRYGNGTKYELQHHGDLPSQSGVGSSSAFAVGIINAIQALQKRTMSAQELANEAIYFEQSILGETVGSQDQIACSVGGMNYISFRSKGWEIEKLKVSEDYLQKFEKNIILVYSGISRLSSDISKSLIENMGKNKSLMLRNAQMATEYANMIQSESDLNCTGEMLQELWEVKKNLNHNAVTPKLEEFYRFGIANGAEGGKVLGAGGGGFFLFWVLPEKQGKFIEKMKSFIQVPIKISKTGSSIIV